MAKQTTAAPTSVGSIASGQVYPLAEFQRITGFGDAAMRTARRKGLKVFYVGGRAFVRGDDFLTSLEKLDAGEPRSVDAV